jgi:hypothetical protein
MEITGTLIYCLQKCKIVQPLENSLVVSNLVKYMYLHMTQQFCSKVTYPILARACIHTKIRMQMFIVALFIISSNWKQQSGECTNCDTLLYICIMEHYSEI